MSCDICAKHRGVGPLVCPEVYADDLVVVSHRPSGALGWLFVDSRRHVPRLADLTDAEAERVGRVSVAAARALQAELDVEAVHTAAAGLAVPHFHQHVFARHAGTPPDHPWWPEWPGAPRGDVEDLARRLRRRLESLA